MVVLSVTSTAMAFLWNHELVVFEPRGLPPRSPSWGLGFGRLLLGRGRPSRPRLGAHLADEKTEAQDWKLLRPWDSWPQAASCGAGVWRGFSLSNCVAFRFGGAPRTLTSTD